MPGRGRNTAAATLCALLFAGPALAASNLVISNAASTRVMMSGGVITTTGPSAVLNVGTLANALANGNVTIRNDSFSAEEGDIVIASAIAWSSPSTLRIAAVHDILINDTVKASGGSVVLCADSKAAHSSISTTAGGTVVFGTTGLVSSPSTDVFYNPPSYATPANYAGRITGTYRAWMLVNDVRQLQDLQLNLAGSYALGRDIDASATASWNNGAGFQPIGNRTTPFTGRLNGNGRTIASLSITRPTRGDVGLFADVTGGTISNLSFTNATITGGSFTGVFGPLLGTTVSNVVVARSRITGVFEVGALSGWVGDCSITNVFVRQTIVTCQGSCGGVAGVIAGGTIADSHSSGSVTTPGSASGGLIGQVFNATVVRCSSTASVSSTAPTLSGIGGFSIGGLIGLATGSATRKAVITDSYATGAVSGDANVGGLIGATGRALDDPLWITVTNCYSAGRVSATGSYSGGLIGAPNSIVLGSYWDTETSGYATSAGGIGKTTAEMKQKATFVGWDFTSTWGIVENITYPYLHAEYAAPLPTSVTVPLDGLYGSGAALDFAVAFSGPVFVNGTPNIPLVIGSTTVAANYVSGSGTSTLLFRYVVQPSDRDMDGISVGSAISLNGGSIVDGDGHSAPITLPAVPSTSRVFVGGFGGPNAPATPVAAPTLDTRMLALLAAALASVAVLVLRGR